MCISLFELFLLPLWEPEGAGTNKGQDEGLPLCASGKAFPGPPPHPGPLPQGEREAPLTRKIVTNEH